MTNCMAQTGVCVVAGLGVLVRFLSPVRVTGKSKIHAATEAFTETEKTR